MNTTCTRTTCTLEISDLCQCTIDKYREQFIQDFANDICSKLPEGAMIRFCFENGYAGFELEEAAHGLIGLGDEADMTLKEQLENAIEIANETYPLNSIE